jgi:hypothetical protein
VQIIIENDGTVSRLLQITQQIQDISPKPYTGLTAPHHTRIAAMPSSRHRDAGENLVQSPVTGLWPKTLCEE